MVNLICNLISNAALSNYFNRLFSEQGEICVFFDVEKHGWRDSGVKSSDQGQDTCVAPPEATRPLYPPPLQIITSPTSRNLLRDI